MPKVSVPAPMAKLISRFSIVRRVAIALGQKIEFFLQRRREFVSQGAHLQPALLQAGAQPRHVGMRRRAQSDVGRQQSEAACDQRLHPVGTALLGRVVGGDFAERLDVRRHARHGGLIGLIIGLVPIDQIAALARFGGLDIVLKLARDFHDLMGVTHQTLGCPLIDGELDGEIGNQRQDQEKR